MKKILVASTLLLGLALSAFSQEPCNFIYVTTNGSSPLGTKANPSSLAQGIAEANASPNTRKHIRIMNGSYNIGSFVQAGNIELLQDNIILEGGYNSNWEKSGNTATYLSVFPPLESATVNGVVVGHIIALKVVGVNNIQLRDFSVSMFNTFIGTHTNRRGHSVYGIYAHNAPNLQLFRLNITATNATNGAAPPTAQNGLNGGTGTCGTIGHCDLSRAEGHGGVGGSGAGNTGNAAGGMISNTWDDSGVLCVNGITGNNGNASNNLRVGGNGGGGGSGSRRGGTGGKGGCGGAGANGVTPIPNCLLTGAGGNENCSDNACNVSTDRGRTGANGVNGTPATNLNTAIQGVPGSLLVFYVPELGNNGADGAGGSGAQGGGGGAGEPNFFDGCGLGGCTADDGSGGGGGGGGGGGQGGEGGQGGGAGGSSFALYTSGTTTYTINQSVFVAGNAGNGTVGANGGIGGLGGIGGRGARVQDLGSRSVLPSCDIDTLYNGTCASNGCSPGETGAGGAGGRGGNGGSGGNGQGGTNGISRAHHDVTAGQVTSSTSIPPFPISVAINHNKGCTNSEITFNKSVLGTWSLGSGGLLTPDIAPGSSSFNTGINAITGYYTTTGLKTIGVNLQSYTDMIDIVQPRALPVITPLNANICVNGSINLATVTTGSGYLWEVQQTPVVSSTNPVAIFTSNVQNPGSVTFNNPGTYQIRLKVLDECCGWSIPVYATLVVDSAVTAPSLPTGTLSRCQGAGTDNYLSMASNATSYTWTTTPGSGVISGTGNTGTMVWDPNFTGLANICVEANGCGGPTTPVCIQVMVTPTVGTPSVPVGISSRCAGAAIDTFTTIAADALTYNWTVTGTNTINGTGTDGIVTWDPNYTGIAQVCVSATGCGTSTVVCHSVTVSGPVGNPSAPNGLTVRCQGAGNEIYTSLASDASSYNWTITGSGNTITGTGGTGTASFDAGFSGVAQVCVAANGCNGPTNPVCTNITVTPTVGTPTIPSGTSLRCVGPGTDQYITLASDASGYNWTIMPSGAGTISPSGLVTWNPTYTGQATITVTANGCNGPSAPSSLQVTINDLVIDPSAPVGNLVRCQGIGSDSYTTSSINATSYTWSVIPSNAGTIAGTTNTESVNWNAAFSGTVSVCVVANGCGISNQICTTVTINPAPAVPLITASGPLSFCDGGSIVLTSSSSSNNTWSPGGELTPSITVNQPGTYSVSVTDNNGCSNVSAPVSVIVNPLPAKPVITIIGDPNLCVGESVSLVSSQNSGILWSTGANTQTISVNQAGIYNVTYTDANGCSNVSDNTIIHQSQISSMISGPDTVCVSESFTLSVSGGNSYAWNTGATTASISPVITGTMVFNVTVQDTLGCMVSLSKNVHIYPIPVAEDDAVNTGQGVASSIAVKANDQGGTIITILVPPEHGSAIVTGDSILYTPVNTYFGTDMLTYVLCDANCPEACDTALVLIVIKEFIELFIPGGISPNGDGFNDVFIISGLENYPDHELVILNRWGDAVYKSAPYQNDWAGTCNTGLKIAGDQLTDGTYFYVFNPGNGEDPIRGYIEIRR